jgi:hypothetical protein
MSFVRRMPAAAVLATVVIAAAGCSSGPSKQSGQAAATQARTQITTEMRSLYQKIYGAHFAWSEGMQGEYQSCPSSSQSSELAYYGFFDALQSFSLSIDSDMYLQQAKALLAADGWKYSHQEAESQATDYFFAKDSITLRMAIVPNTKMSGDNSIVTAWGPCFDAGSDAQQLQQSSSQSTTVLPHPSPLPSSSSSS